MGCSMQVPTDRSSKTAHSHDGIRNLSLCPIGRSRAFCPGMASGGSASRTSDFLAMLPIYPPKSWHPHSKKNSRLSTSGSPVCLQNIGTIIARQIAPWPFAPSITIHTTANQHPSSTTHGCRKCRLLEAGTVPTLRTGFPRPIICGAGRQKRFCESCAPCATIPRVATRSWKRDAKLRSPSREKPSPGDGLGFSKNPRKDSGNKCLLSFGKADRRCDSFRLWLSIGSAGESAFRADRLRVQAFLMRMTRSLLSTVPPT